MSIILNKIDKFYGTQHVVRDVSLEIETGELFVLLGASGSGKSTLLRLIAGLNPQDNGQIILHGRDVTHLPPQARNTGFVFQNYSLFRHMTAAQNIEFGLEIRRLPKAERKRRVDELLQLIGLPKMGDRLPSQLSGGEQQRVALARALAYEPSVLLLDEPFGALDVKIRSQLRQNLREIQKRLQVTAILVTHDQEDRIGIIEQGKLLEVGTPASLYQQPQTTFTATFLGSANLLPAQRNGSSVYVGDARLPAPPATDHLSGKTVQLLCRPEEILLFPSREAVSGELIGSGQVESISFVGHMLRVAVRLQGKDASVIQAVVTPGEARSLGLSPGQEVWVGIGAYHLLPYAEA
jgi:sulfate/thiosulfate transport system ATP-binding protein